MRPPPRVEISPGNCIPESQIILHTRGSMPCWRIVFSTFCGCMSFYTGSVKIVLSVMSAARPLSPHEQTSAGTNRTAASCRYCCKSPKLPGVNFPAVKKSDRRLPIDVASITLPGSPASFSSDDEVPHIFTWKSPVQPKEILIASAKRLLQQNLPTTAVSTCSKTKHTSYGRHRVK